MNGRLQGITAALLLVIFLFACSDKTTILQNVNTGEQVKLSGGLYAWHCGIGDLINNNGRKPLFGVQTGDTARVIIEYLNGWKDTVYTDSLSHFERLISKGLHRILVDTRYTRTDTFQVNAETDTTMPLDIVYDTDDPARIDAVFLYPSANDTLSLDSEWVLIQVLNEKLGWAIEMENTPPPGLNRSVYSTEPGAIVWYALHLSNRRLNVLEVNDRAAKILESDTTGLPPGSKLGLTYVLWPCMD